MKTVKVRIAVAVDDTGRWQASGWRNQKDSDAMATAIEFLDSTPEARYFIEAELLVPEVQTIQGTIAPRGPE